MNDILRNRLQAAYLAREPGTSWEERVERAVMEWHEEQNADLRTLVRNAEGIVRIFARDNPRWTPAGGQEQDPYGAHAWLAALFRLTQGAESSLSSLLEEAAQHQMTLEEIARQRASWARGQAGWDESAAPAREAAP